MEFVRAVNDIKERKQSSLSCKHLSQSTENWQWSSHWWHLHSEELRTFFHLSFACCLLTVTLTNTDQHWLQAMISLACYFPWCTYMTPDMSDTVECALLARLLYKNSKRSHYKITENRDGAISEKKLMIKIPHRHQKIFLHWTETLKLFAWRC